MRLTLAVFLVLLGCAVVIPDWNTRPEGLHSNPEPEFWVWTAPRWEGHADPLTKACAVRYFVLTTGDPVRLNADGVEQALDTSWTFDWTVKKGSKLTKRFWFIDPRSGETLRYVERSFRCRPPKRKVGR